MDPGSKWALGATVPKAQTRSGPKWIQGSLGPGPKQTLDPNGPYAQMRHGLMVPWPKQALGQSNGLGPNRKSVQNIPPRLYVVDDTKRARPTEALHLT